MSFIRALHSLRSLLNGSVSIPAASQFVAHRFISSSTLVGPVAHLCRGAGVNQSIQSRPPIFSLSGPLHSQAVRTLFAATKKAVNPQNHQKNWDKLKVLAQKKHADEKPKYDWMVGRFIRDQNGLVWRRQAHQKGALKRSKLRNKYVKKLVPLHKPIAKKMRMLGFNRRYWMDPDPAEVPGFNSGRMAKKAGLNGDVDFTCPALRRHKMIKRKMRVFFKSAAPAKDGYYRLAF